MVARIVALNSSKPPRRPPGCFTTVENLHSKGLRRCPPDPMNNVKIFKGWPRPEAFCYWYTANTNLLNLTILVTRKSEYQLCWVIKPVPHNLVWRIRFWRIKSFEQDFKYLYWTISKIIIWNLFTSKGTYWVARAGWIERSWIFFFFSFLEFESQNAGISKWRRRGVGARSCAPGGLRGVVRGEYNVLRAGADPGEITLRN